ncbi:cobalt-precorrin-6A reductase [Alisedimentitalea sp. MJ-SS2]|uniref:cobalt-precorrin-6A reductase n=1 Tax=Aliisedimentitalea sp. MJ-SS2 TaxID=3049795 RepID=UPI00290C1CC9|nr:cobalt-precorrin-6A reductase [Alisedimentitalea sp. MJ-SS2]MDU8926434.1 cobalt-precorrin-6A reductase [Alisedimentitalea sp. MJ-SS2]
MTLLLLAGTAEAREIASRIAEEGVQAVASFAGATKAPAVLDLPMRSGGFGGKDGFRKYLREERISAVLDATHPFAARISERTARVCGELGLPLCLVLRPAWEPTAKDDWVSLKDETDAMNHVPEGAVVFLATGRQRLEKFAGLVGRRVICRVVDPQQDAFPFENGEYLVGRPSEDVAEEEALFQRHDVEWLIARNAGGQAARAKLEAARNLGIRVGLIERPAPPQGISVQTVDAALDWVRGLP